MLPWRPEALAGAHPVPLEHPPTAGAVRGGTRPQDPRMRVWQEDGEDVQDSHVTSDLRQVQTSDAHRSGIPVCSLQDDPPQLHPQVGVSIQCHVGKKGEKRPRESEPGQLKKGPEQRTEYSQHWQSTSMANQQNAEPPLETQAYM